MYVLILFPLIFYCNMLLILDIENILNKIHREAQINQTIIFKN